MKQQWFDYKGFSKAVKRYRVGLKLNLRDAAEQSGIGFSTLSRIENDAFKTGVDTVLALCDWMETPINEFVKTKK